MEIQYLKFYEKNLEKIEGKYIIPFVENIEASVENKIGRTFPKAYKEFMYLAIGKPRIYDSGISSSLEYGIERQETVKNLLADNGFKFSRDFWVIAELDGGEQFDFFYFDDPDAEDPENPPVYFFDNEYIDEENASTKNIHKSFDSFDKYVNGNAKVRIEEKGLTYEDE
ncbi:hypothetical protein GTQ40_08205 [Flavobacteriaceae bacterium R38]|nr:hypothetical protein [Flavobacteriaceae bacterium R38]